MKKIIALIAFLFASTFCIGQNNILSVDPPLQKSPGTPFTINFQVINPPSGCTTQEVILNIGSLIYSPSSNLNYLDGASVVESYNGTDTILTISGITYSGGGGAQRLSVGVEILPGTCVGTQFTINATTVACSQTINTAIPITITSQANANPSASISLMTSSQPFCLGKVVKYRISAQSSNNGYYFNTHTMVLNIPKCTEIVGVFKSGSYIPVDGGYSTTTQATTIQAVWDVPITNPNAYAYHYDVYIRFKCNDTCNNGTNNVSAFFTGSTSCNTTVSSNTATHSTQITTACTANNCDGFDPVTIVSGSSFPCNNTCNTTTKYVTFQVSVPPPPGNSPYANRQFTLAIPSGVIPTSVSPFVQFYPETIQVKYYDSNNAITPTIGLAKKIVWTFPNAYVYPSTSFTLYFNYDSAAPPSPGASLTFDYSFKVNETDIIPPGSHSGTVQNCNSSLSTFKRVKKVNATSYGQSDYNSTESGFPGDVFTYKLSIVNYGSAADVGTIIKDVLHSKLLYQGGFRYAFVNSTSNPTFTSLGTNNSFVLPGTAETINVTLPTIGSSGTIELSGFNFPCSSKVLYLEFDVKINSDAVFNEQIPNTVRVNNLSNSNTATIKILERQKVSCEMLAKCASGTWSNSTISARNGEVLSFKMKFSNDGTIPVTLSRLLNQKPHPQDTFEMTSQQRGSQFSIDYKCSSAPVLTSSSATNPNPAVVYQYANNDAAMNRTGLLCAQTPNTGNTPVWNTSCGLSSNWFNAEFTNGLLLNPGEYVEIVYKGVVSGTSGENAINSFAYTLLNCSLSSDDAQIVINVTDEGCAPPTNSCIDCTSFNLIRSTPETVSKYLISGWVKESDPNKPQEQLKHFGNTAIKIYFKDISGAVISSQDYYTSGEIIDGWQRIIGEFVVPENTDDFFLELVNNDPNENGRTAYFDDIRVLPTKGSMKSFVYDQRTLRLMAELDENNYGTFYEYDLEGGLVRIKKETEKGVFTIQETRSDNSKPSN